MNQISEGASTPSSPRIGRYSRLHVATFSAALKFRSAALKIRDQNSLPTEDELIAAIQKDFSAAPEEIRIAIEELQAEGTLLRLTDGRIYYCSDD